MGASAQKFFCRALAQRARRNITMPINTIPVIDISPFRSDDDKARNQVADRIAQACTEIGFLIISGHGIPSSTIRRMVDVSKEFFALDVTEKNRIGRPRPEVIRGYGGMETEGLAYSQDEETPPDLKEVFDVGPIYVPNTDYFRGPAAGVHFADNLWPNNPAAMRDVYVDYFHRMERLTSEMMHIFATALDLPTTFFDSKIDRHISILRTNYYPKFKQPPRAKQLRGGEHSDYTAFTILWQERTPSLGLQARGTDGEWIDVPAIDDTLVVNIGDSLMRWTNDKWISTQHRVVNPPFEIGRDHDRLSLVYFVQPNYDAEIKCIESCQSADEPAKYPPVLNGDYLFSKFSKQSNMELGTS
jgi:isopenicillin N synthase-like dioxygenase